MADLQFGMYEDFSKLNDKEIQNIRIHKGMNILKKHPQPGLDFEIENYNKAIHEANRLNPEFVIICGDMINSTQDSRQFQNFIKITNKLSKNIKIYWAAGNHDIDNQELTDKSLNNYRKDFGSDQYYFDYNRYRFIVINSNITFNPTKLPKEWNKQLEFLTTTLKDSININNKIVFLHHPLFIKSPYEENNFISIHKPHRNILLSLFDQYNVKAVFAGHWHRNSYSKYKGIEMITSGPVGYPLGKDPSGFRIVKASDNELIHKYYSLESMPDEINI